MYSWNDIFLCKIEHNLTLKIWYSPMYYEYTSKYKKKISIINNNYLSHQSSQTCLYSAVAVFQSRTWPWFGELPPSSFTKIFKSKSISIGRHECRHV